MKYLGGKFRISKKITAYINDIRKENQTYIEPFVGGGAIIININTNKGINRCSDIHPGLIALYNAIKSGWMPPDIITEQQYQELKLKNDMNDPLTAFAGFGCSYGGKYFGGYARSGNRIPPENYCGEAKHFFQKIYPKTKDIEFMCCDYTNYTSISNSIIYCDPPYKAKTEYTHKFNHKNFYKFLIHLKNMNNIVLISEYQMPQEFNCVLELPTKTSLNNVNSHSNDPIIEKLWEVA